MHLLQYAQKIRKDSSTFLAKSTKVYVLSMLMSTGKKNCSAMSSELGLSYRSLHQYFDNFGQQKNEIKRLLANLANYFSTEANPGVLIVDTTQIMKLYSRKMEFVCYDFNGSMKNIFKGISCVTVAWCNGEVLIPLDFDFWIREKDLKGGKKYKKKTEIARELILEWKDKVAFSYIPLDGDYGNETFLRFLHQHDLLYSIRMPTTRKVAIENEPEIALKKQPFFQFKRNARYKSTKCTYKGIETYITAHKRNGPNNTKQTVFVVSNMENLSPKQHIDAYELRWPIEKTFRTTKQHLGLQHCQSISIEKQRAHIFASFLAFVKLELIKIDKKKKSPEEALKFFRCQNLPQKNQPIIDLEGFIM